MVSRRITLHGQHFVPLHTAAELEADMRRVATRLNSDLPSMHRPLALVVLNGAFVFAADLLRALTHDLPVEFVRYTSYAGAHSTGQVSQLLGLKGEVHDRDILVIEDIVDSGLTMRHMIHHLHDLGARSVRVATMFSKPEAFAGDYPLDYVGRELPNRFVVGYGLDYDELGRNLPDLYILEE